MTPLRSVGTYSYSAIYSGDAADAASTSQVLSLSVVTAPGATVRIGAAFGTVAVAGTAKTIPVTLTINFAGALGGKTSLPLAEAVTLTTNTLNTASSQQKLAATGTETAK